ncbi:membrane protein TolA [Salmonella sp. NCTC 11881]|nr:membrane protein TolA [Salmonella sp. NCTC 11881]
MVSHRKIAVHRALTVGATGADISAYAKQIQVAIQSRLYDASLYQGKQCVLHISLAPDGLIKKHYV